MQAINFIVNGLYRLLSKNYHVDLLDIFPLIHQQSFEISEKFISQVLTMIIPLTYKNVKLHVFG
jgi:hypothetical protein